MDQSVWGLLVPFQRLMMLSLWNQVPTSGLGACLRGGQAGQGEKPWHSLKHLGTLVGDSVYFETSFHPLSQSASWFLSLFPDAYGIQSYAARMEGH